MNLYRPASSASIIIRQFTGTFQDVYTWAGNIRTVRIGKDGRMFCYPEHIRSQMRTLFGRLRRGRYLRDLTPDEFVLKATTFLATLNAIHPFRDGNGRTQLAFMALLAACAGHSLFSIDCMLGASRGAGTGAAVTQSALATTARRAAASSPPLVNRFSRYIACRDRESVRQCANESGFVHASRDPSMAQSSADIRKRIDLKLTTYATDGSGDVKRLKGGGGCRLRIGDWRVIFIEDVESITVIAVGNRREIYD